MILIGKTIKRKQRSEYNVTTSLYLVKVKFLELHFPQEKKIKSQNVDCCFPL